MSVPETCTFPQQKASASTATPDPLDAPLADLLAAHRVELVESSITDATFFGAYVERRDGTRVLSMPVGRSPFEQDTAARMLLADGLGFGASPVPAPLSLSRV